jgi:hypothetical protein
MQERRKRTPLVEICRSFCFRLNVGNYESRDFFCSEKAECHEKDAEAVSHRLYEFCRREVMRAVGEWKATAGIVPAVHPVAQQNAREFEKRQVG